MKQIHPEPATGPVQPKPLGPLPCRYLRCKEMFYEQPGPRGAPASDAFWCARTQEAFGPDGEPAENGTCDCGRACYISA